MLLVLDFEWRRSPEVYVDGIFVTLANVLLDVLATFLLDKGGRGKLQLRPGDPRNVESARLWIYSSRTDSVVNRNKLVSAFVLDSKVAVWLCDLDVVLSSIAKAASPVPLSTLR